MPLSRFSILITLCAALPVTSPAARADSPWPPLNAIEERSSNPVRVGDATFTTGYYSWYVPEYSVPSLHYSQTVNSGPREWWAVVGLGGNEPIGPRSGSNEVKVSQSTPAAFGTLPPVTPLPQLSNALPTIANLPAMASLPAVSTLNNLPSLPSLSP